MVHPSSQAGLLSLYHNSLDCRKFSHGEHLLQKYKLCRAKTSSAQRIIKVWAGKIYSQFLLKIKLSQHLVFAMYFAKELQNLSWPLYLNTVRVVKEINRLLIFKQRKLFLRKIVSFMFVPNRKRNIYELCKDLMFVQLESLSSLVLDSACHSLSSALECFTHTRIHGKIFKWT